MSYNPGKARNFIAGLKRAADKAWFGEVAGVEQFAIPPIIDNGEALPTINSNGNAPVPTISVSGSASTGANGPNPSNVAYIPLPTPVSYSVVSNTQLGTTRFFISDNYYRVSAIRFNYKTAGTSASIAIQVTKDAVSTTTAVAPGAGTPLLATAFDGVNTVVDTPTIGTLVSMAAALYLTPGDSLSVLFTGTLTTIAGVTITVDLVNTCSVNLGGVPTYSPAALPTVGKTLPTNIVQYYVKNNGEVATQTVFVANRDMTVYAVYATIVTAFGAAITIDITKDTSTNAPGAGSSILTATMDATVANKLIVPTIDTTTVNRQNLLAGDRLAIKYSATTTGAGVCITIVLAPLYERLEITLPIGNAAADKAAQYFFIASRFYEVVDLSCTYAVVAGSASTAAITIDKQLTAPGAGNVVQTDNTNTGFDLTATANTVQVGSLAALRLRLMSPGDRLGLKVSGAAAPTGTCITVSLRPRP